MLIQQPSRKPLSVERPLFIVSAPCAGTSPIFELLSRARHVRTLNNASRNELRTRLEAGDITADQIRRLVRDGLRDRGGHVRWLSAIVTNARQIPLLNEAYPDALFIYVHRDAKAQLARMMSDRPDVAPEAIAAEWSETTSRIMSDLAALPARRWCAVDIDGFLSHRPQEAALLGRFATLSWRVKIGPAARTNRRPHADAFASTAAAVLPALASDAAVFAQANHASLRDLPEESFWQAVKALPENVAKAVVSSRLAAGLAIGAAAVPVAAIASTLTVTSAGDTGDAGELRTEVAAASPGDTINFDPSLNGQTITLNGPLTIKVPLTIEGPGSDKLTIDGNATFADGGLTGGSGIFYLYAFTPVDGGLPTPENVTISGLTLQHGNDTAGGAVRAIGTNVSLSGMAIKDNHASEGGGVAVAELGSLQMQNSTVSGNVADQAGGGVVIYLLDGGVLLDQVVVTGNSAPGSSGSGLPGGAGVALEGSPAVTIENSTIAANTSGTDMGQAFGGGLLVAGGGVTLLDSTVSGNAATGGGGVLFYGARATLVNSTVAGNSAFVYGSGVGAFNSELAVDESTIAGNTDSVELGGGGLFAFAGTNAVLTNSIVAGNTDHVDGGAIVPNDVATIGATVTANFSLVQAISPINLDGGTEDGGISIGDGGVIIGTGTIVGQDPQLGALADNGGPTKTMLPGAGSPVINAGDRNFGLDDAGDPTTDQRGLPRVVDGRVDMGAVEVQSSDAGSTSSTDGGTKTTTSGKGCSCNGSSDAALALLTPIGLLLMRRRRRAV